MTAATPTFVAYSLAAYLANMEIVDATSIATSRESAKVMEPQMRSYVGPSPWAGHAGYQSITARSEDATFVVADRSDETIIASVVDLLDLKAGWDGEHAAAPILDAVVDAIQFLNVAGSLASRLEPTLHVDGSVILELDDGSAGSLRFKGDGTLVYAFDGVPPGVVAFDGYAVPEQIGAALRA